MKNINNKFVQYKKNRKIIEKEIFTNNNLSKRKIGIIVPFREQKQQKRGEQLKQFLEYMPKFMKGLNYKLYIIEQSNDNKKFNRGKLLNIGMDLAIKDKCNILISHDVDLLPCKELKPYYAQYPNNPIHIGDRWKDKYNYFTFIGGILSLSPKLVKQSNGYPNNFWGWGGEDDALYNRLSKFVDKIELPSTGCINELKHIDTSELKQLTNLKKKENILNDLNNWNNNGMNNLNYKILKKKNNIYTVLI